MCSNQRYTQIEVDQYNFSYLAEEYWERSSKKDSLGASILSYAGTSSQPSKSFQHLPFWLAFFLLILG